MWSRQQRLSHIFDTIENFLHRAFILTAAVAGCLIVVDLMRSQSTKDLTPTNYLHMDPWRPPTPVRRLKARRARCEFCGDPELKAVFASLWDAPAGF
jgi:hypothetical protein